MIFFSLFCALLIDHFRPTRAGEFFSGSIRMIAGCVRKWCDTGLVHHARMGWIMVVVIFTLPVLVVYWICLAIHPFFRVVVEYPDIVFVHGVPALQSLFHFHSDGAIEWRESEGTEYACRMVSRWNGKCRGC